MNERLQAHRVWTSTMAVVDRVNNVLVAHRSQRDSYPDQIQWKLNCDALEDLLRRSCLQEAKARAVYLQLQEEADKE